MTEVLPSGEDCAHAWRNVFTAHGVAPSAWMAFAEQHCPELLSSDGTNFKKPCGCSPAQVQRYALAHGSTHRVPNEKAIRVLKQVFRAAQVAIRDEDDRFVAETSLKVAVETSRLFNNKGSIGGAPAKTTPLTQGMTHSRDEVELEYLGLREKLSELEPAMSVAVDEAGYFRRWFEIVSQVEKEIVVAYIRPLSAPGPDWMQGFYEKLKVAVCSGNLEISYVFFEEQKHLRSKDLSERYGQFSTQIRFVRPMDFPRTASMLQTSFVLFTTQRVALSFERDGNEMLINAREWRTTNGYRQFEERYELITQAWYTTGASEE